MEKRTYNQNTKRFYPLFAHLLQQHETAPVKDGIDLFKSVFNISETSPDFISKIIVCLEDFKTWKLEEESKGLVHSTSELPQEWRIKTNEMIEAINRDHPFADLKPENRVFFESFKRIIDNRELESCKEKLTELSKMYSSQETTIERLQRQLKYGFGVSIFGIFIGICGLIARFL